MGKIHDLKIAEDYADSIACGNKTYEVRYNDRDYQKGDIIEFKVMCRGSSDDRKLEHWLDGKLYRITHVHSGLGMADMFVVLGITPVPEHRVIAEGEPTCGWGVSEELLYREPKQ